MAEVAMPKLSDSMEDGTIVAWLIEDGAEVAIGDDLVEIETDKATMVYAAEQAGVLRALAAEGEVVAVGAPIAALGAADGVAEEADPGAAAPPAEEAREASPRRPGERVVATPLARRIAAERGVPLELVAGTGPGGRVRKRDVEAAVEGGLPAAPAANGAGAAELVPAVAPTPETAKGAVSALPLSGIEKRISRRMAESKATVPDFAVEMEVGCAQLVALRERLRAVADPAPSLNDLVIKATARALRQHPRVNASFREDHLDLYDNVNIGVAVASDRGLFVPTIFDADRCGLTAISARVREVAAAVRDGSIAPNDLSGGTFTVSNLGMYGVSRFTAVVNPPQAAILAVGGLREKLELEDGEVREIPTMDLTLCCDHRVIDGAGAAEFLRTLKQLLEEPLLMAL